MKSLDSFKAAMAKKGAIDVDASSKVVMAVFDDELKAKDCHASMKADAIVQNPFGDKHWHVIWNV